MFLKFSTGFSDKYKTEPLTLSPDALERLKRYMFKGNIRELKNLVEQISLLETKRVLGAEALDKYLKAPQTTMSLVPKAPEKAHVSEKEILYSVLFDMRKDMNELKKVVFRMLQEKKDGSAILEENESIFENVDKHVQDFAQPKLLAGSQGSANVSSDDFAQTPVRRIAPEEGEEVLDLAQMEKDLITKALQKYPKSKRLSAKALGISERTLYRKIKQYDLED